MINEDTRQAYEKKMLELVIPWRDWIAAMRIKRGLPPLTDAEMAMLEYWVQNGEELDDGE